MPATITKSQPNGDWSGGKGILTQCFFSISWDAIIHSCQNIRHIFNCYRPMEVEARVLFHNVFFLSVGMLLFIHAKLLGTFLFVIAKWEWRQGYSFTMLFFPIRGAAIIHSYQINRHIVIYLLSLSMPLH